MERIAEQVTTDEMIITELEENEFATKTAKKALLGKIYTDKSLSKKVIKSMTKKGWGEPEGLTIVDISPNTILFNFTESKTLNRILQEAPWNILESAMESASFSTRNRVHTYSLLDSTSWNATGTVSKQNTTLAGSKFGKVLEAEDPFQGTSINRGFLRTKVSINIKDPLIAGFWIHRPHLPKIWVQVRYEKLMDFCYNCRRLRHEQRLCKRTKIMDPMNPTKSMYGPWMDVQPLKKIGDQAKKTVVNSALEFTEGKTTRTRDTESEDQHFHGNGNCNEQRKKRQISQKLL